MDNSKIKLYRCFISLDEGFFNNFTRSIKTRIIFQKYGLIFDKIFGLKFGNYSLYLHGPYNTTLADIGYEFANDAKNYYMENANDIVFPELTNDILKHLPQFLPLNDVHFIEVFCTYFYLLNSRNFSQDEAIQKVREIKKALFSDRLTIDDITTRYNDMRNYINTATGSSILS